MIRLLALIVCIVYFPTTGRTQSFSFNCTRDTLIAGCTPDPCFKIRAVVPNLKSSTDNYIVNPITNGNTRCMPMYANPGDPGTPTNLVTDDIYSSVIPIGFPFHYYGQVYNSLVVSTNGVVSFSTALANQPAEWALINGASPQDLPSTFYDQALIMGPFHDINIEVPSSAQRQIQYVTVGAAPNRKWIVSFYMIPLYSDPQAVCAPLINNTHQIVLNESTGVIEVLIQSKEICTAWQDGRAMVGIQDQTRTRAVMAPNRRASDPPWGTPNMNEGWRFVPAGGVSLFKRAELWELGGTTALETVMSPTPVANGELEILFNMTDICATPGTTTTYLVKTYYTTLDDPGGEVFGIDTINVTRTAATDLNATASATPSACGQSSGSITVEVPTGIGTAPFQYMIDGGSLQTSKEFQNLAAGSHTVRVVDATGCESILNVTVPSTGELDVQYVAVNPSCSGANDGSITVTPPVGTAPFTYTLGSVSGNNPVFSNLAPGNYLLSVRDAGGCQKLGINITLTQGPALTFTSAATATSCPGVNDGTLTITPTSGVAPFEYSINAGPFQPGSTFTGLAPSPSGYFVMIRDSRNCLSALTLTVPVPQGPATVTGSVVATPTGCAGVNNGTITVTPAGGSGAFEYSIDNGTNWQTSNIFGGLAPGNYNVIIRAGGICVSNPIPAIVNTGSAMTATATATATTCAGATNGVITVNAPTTGTAPFSYSIDGGAGQASNVFSNLSSGNHTILVTDAAGCTSTPLTVTVTAGPPLSSSQGVVATSCLGASDGSIILTVQNGTSPMLFSLNGGTPQASNIFTNLAAGDYTVTYEDALGCNSGGDIPVTVPAGPAITGTATALPTACAGVDNGSITVTVGTGFTGPFEYALNGGAFQASNIFNNVAAGNHNVTIRSMGGCVSAAIPVTVGANAQLAFGFTTSEPTCNGDNNATIQITPGNGSAPFEYSLNGGPWQTTETFTGLTAGTYSVAVRDAFGCGATQDITIGQPAALTAVAPVQNATCNGESNGLITVNASGGTAPYTYSINGGAFLAPNTFNVGAGTYTIVVRDANNCEVTLNNVTVTEPAPLTAIINGTTDATCEGGANGTITVIASGGTAAYQYSINGIDFQSPNTLQVTAGTYTVTVRDANNCTFVIPGVSVGMINNLTLTADPDPAPICEGTSVRIQVQSNATQYAWTPAATLDNPSVPNPLANPVTTTQYTVTATLGLCTATADISVTVMPAPRANAGPDAEICFGQDYQLQASGGLSYTWSPATFLDNPSIPNPRVTQPNKTMRYQVIAIDANNCASLQPDEMILTVTPPIKVTITPADTIVYAGDVFRMTATSAGTDYSWTPATGLDNPSIANPMVTAPGIVGAEVVYHVEASTPAGCRGEGVATVRVYRGPDIYMATAFTPNNDGRNDRFIPYPVGIKQLNYFRIYNRWGQLLFSTTALHQGWDGTFGGAEQATGAYTWVIQAVTHDNRVITKKGTVTLIR